MNVEPLASEPWLPAESLLTLASEAARDLPLRPLTCRPLPGGRVNRTFLVTTEQEPVILRLSPSSRRPRQVRFELSVLSELSRRGLRVPAPLFFAGEPAMGRAEGCIAVWQTYVPGTTLGPERTTWQLAALVELLRAVRDGLDACAHPFRPVPETRVFENAMLQLVAQLHARRADAEWVQRSWGRLASWEATLTLPTSIVHADLHPGNIVVHQRTGEPWLLDFDDAHVSWRALDWVLAALEFSVQSDGSVDEPHYEAFLHSLSRGRATAQERAVFPQLRELLLLKFAATLAALGAPVGDNIYLRLLGKSAA